MTTTTKHRVPESNPADILATNVIACIRRNTEVLVMAGELDWRDRKELREIISELSQIVGDGRKGR